MGVLTTRIQKMTSCEKGFSLISSALVINGVFLLGGLAALLISESTEKSFISQLRAFYAEQGNKNSAIIIKKLVELNLVGEDPSTHNWAYPSNTTISNHLWSVDSGVVSVGFCDPFKNSGFSTDGTPTNLNTCTQFKPQITLQGNVAGRKKITLSTTFHEVRRDLTALLPAGPNPTASLLINGAHDPVSILNGYSVNLAWSSTNATSCTVTRSDGVSCSKTASNCGDATHPALIRATNPKLKSKTHINTGSSPMTVTYTLTCVGSGATATDSLDVMVNSCPRNMADYYDVKGTTINGYYYAGSISSSNQKGYHVSFNMTDPNSCGNWVITPGQKSHNTGGWVLHVNGTSWKAAGIDAGNTDGDPLGCPNYDYIHGTLGTDGKITFSSYSCIGQPNTWTGIDKNDTSDFYINGATEYPPW